MAAAAAAAAPAAARRVLAVAARCIRQPWWQALHAGKPCMPASPATPRTHTFHAPLPAAGGYRMLSMIDATGRRTAACALRNCLYLFPLGALATWLGVTSPYFAYESGACCCRVAHAQRG